MKDSQVRKVGLPPLLSFSSNRKQQIAAELLRAILPGLCASETRRLSQLVDINQIILIRILSMNLFTLSELHLHVELPDSHSLFACAPDINFYAPCRFIVERAMRKGAQVKLATKLPIDARQHIQIESGRHPERVVVGSFQHGLVLFQIRAQQKRVAFVKHPTQRPQKLQSFIRVKVADVRTKKECQRPRPR